MSSLQLRLEHISDALGMDLKGNGLKDIQGFRMTRVKEAPSVKIKLEVVGSSHIKEGDLVVLAKVSHQLYLMVVEDTTRLFVFVISTPKLGHVIQTATNHRVDFNYKSTLNSIMMKYKKGIVAVYTRTFTRVDWELVDLGDLVC